MFAIIIINSFTQTACSGHVLYSEDFTCGGEGPLQFSKNGRVIANCGRKTHARNPAHTNTSTFACYGRTL